MHKSHEKHYSLVLYMLTLDSSRFRNQSNRTKSTIHLCCTNILITDIHWWADTGVSLIRSNEPSGAWPRSAWACTTSWRTASWCRTSCPPASARSTAEVRGRSCRAGYTFVPLACPQVPWVPEVSRSRRAGAASPVISTPALRDREASWLDSAALSGPAFGKERRLNFPSQRLEPSLRSLWNPGWPTGSPLGFNPFTPKSDQHQTSPAASPEILHHTVRRTWLFIGYSDERWLHYQFSLPHPYISL